MHAIARKGSDMNLSFVQLEFNRKTPKLCHYINPRKKPNQRSIFPMRCMMCSNYLVDDDSGWLPELSLWNKYMKDSILQRGLDSIVLNTAREVEGTAELSEASF